MARDLSQSRAILIGNGTFTDSERLPAVPALGCVAAMRDLLTSELCGWPAGRIELFEDVAAPSDLASKLVRSVRGIDGMLVVYYAGHGLLTMAGHLALALKDTEVDPEALPYTAIPYESLAKIMGYSPAATKLVILDCCYSETANQANFGTQSAGLSDVPPVDGLYFIGASKSREKAQFPLHGDLTYFTEAFIDTVRAGIAGQPPAPELTLGDIFRALRTRLVAGGLPEPADSGIRDARQYPFAVNAVTLAAAGGDRPGDPAGKARLRILDQAEHAAAEIRGKTSQAMALLAVAAALTPDDHDRALRLSSRAVRMVSGANARSNDLRQLAGALAAIDLDRAARIAAAITEPVDRDSALSEVARTTAAKDPRAAAELAASIAGAERRASSLAEVAGIVAASDPDRAEQIARTITDSYRRACALMRSAEAFASTDPRRAEEIAVSVASHFDIWPSTNIVEMLARTDLEAAERVARAIPDSRARPAPDSYDRDRALRIVAKAVARSDPGRARHIMHNINAQVPKAGQRSSWPRAASRTIRTSQKPSPTPSPPLITRAKPWTRSLSTSGKPRLTGLPPC